MILDRIVEAIVFLIQELGLFAVGATVIGWVAKDVITQYFDKELNKYQAELDKEMNRYQAELDKEKLQFSALHNKRAKITAELYERFVVFEEDVRALTDPVSFGDEPPKEEQIQTAAKSGNEFINFYMKNKIYFPPRICETIEEVQEEMSSVFNEFKVYQPHQKNPGSPPDVEKWENLWKRVSEEDVPELKGELESHFRDLLGVEIEE